MGRALGNAVPVKVRRGILVARVSLVVATLAAAGFGVANAAGASTQVQGAALAVAFIGIAAAAAAWGLAVIPQREVVDQHEVWKGDADAGEPIPRGPALLGFALTALGVIGVALLVPLRSLAPGGPPPRLSKWARGVRLVGENGAPIRTDALETGSILTAFPEGNMDDPWSPVMLIRVPPDAINAPEPRSRWTPLGYVAYSKICTHAGCPVALYKAASYQLLCPCHQSEFDVINGAKPIAGPAPKALPQLPLIVEDGYIVASDGLSGQVGPETWNG